mgnify:CR=1 FL=1
MASLVREAAVTALREHIGYFRELGLTYLHLMPLFAAVGAASEPRGARVHAGHAFGVLAMDVYEFA